MSRSLVIAEKPSQARNYESALGKRYGDIFAARGHLFTLMNPEEINPAEWGKPWKPGLLRRGGEIYPQRLGDDPDYHKRYKAILAAAKDASRIIIATDPDREGQGIGGDILTQLRADIGAQKFDRIEILRVLPLGESKADIEEAFAKAQPNSNFRLLYQAYLARTNADKIYGFSMTRSASSLLSKEGVISIGRVQTPTMAMICRRELAIQNFVPEDYFQPWIDVAGDAGTARLTFRPEEKIKDRAAADAIMAALRGFAGPITVVESRKKQPPPALFSKNRLQVAARKAYGWAVQKTSDVLQNLYEKGLSTYPRSSEVSVPESEIANAPKLMKSVLALGIGGGVSWKGDEPVIRRKKGAFSDKDLRVGTNNPAPHYAIIPNIKKADQFASIYGSATEDEKKLFQLIAKQYLAALGPDRIYDATKLSVQIAGHPFTASGTVEITPGWREVFGATAPKDDDDEDGDEDEGALPKFRDGDPVREAGVGVKTLQTTPPPRLTEDAIALMMIEAWKEVKDPRQRALLKNADNPGIGTESSRDGVVDVLKRRGYIRVEKQFVHAGEAGMQLFKLLTDIDPRTLDVGLTGEMEVGLEDIMKGGTSATGVLDMICGVATGAIEGMKRASAAGRKLTVSTRAPRQPTAGMKAAAKSKAKKEGKKSPPPGVLTDFDKCRAYLGPMEDRPRPPEGQPWPPSEGQVSFARKLAGEQGIEVPPDVLADKTKISKWIDAHKKTGGGSKGGSASGSGARSGGQRKAAGGGQRRRAG